MKLEALEKAVVTAREQARILESKARQLAQTARTAKDKARQAKSKLKLAKQEAKRTRRAAKAAKRALAEVLVLSETAADKLALLEREIKKSRKKAPRPHAKSEQPKPAVVPRPTASKLVSQATKPVAAKSPPKPAAPAKPLPGLDLKRAQPVAPRQQSGIQVPRDFTPKPSVAPAAGPAKSEPSTSPGGNVGN